VKRKIRWNNVHKSEENEIHFCPVYFVIAKSRSYVKCVTKILLQEIDTIDLFRKGSTPVVWSCHCKLLGRTSGCATLGTVLVMQSTSFTFVRPNQTTAKCFEKKAVCTKGSDPTGKYTGSENNVMQKLSKKSRNNKWSYT
jgi:hypothetical protein